MAGYLLRIAVTFAFVFAIAAPLILNSAVAQNIEVPAPVAEIGDQVHYLDSYSVDSQVTIAVTPAGSVVRAESGDELWLDTYNNQLNWTMTEAHDGNYREVLEPSSLKYKFPLFVGSQWSGDYTTTVYFGGNSEDNITRRYQTSVSCEVECIERISVAAGLFETFKVSCDLDYKDRSPQERQTYWYSPVVGATVRSETVIAATGVLDYWYELDAYTRIRPVEFNVLPDGVESTCNLTISMDDTNARAQD